MSGMVHDIGKQVLGFFFNDLFGMVIEEIRTKNATMYEVEKDVLGISHTDIGAALAGKWQLPDFLTSVIGGHQDPSGQDTTPAMTHLIHFSNACANTIGFSFIQKPTEPTIDPKTLELLGMENEAAAALFKELEPTVRSQVTDTFSAIFS